MPTESAETLRLMLRKDLRDRKAYGAPQLDVPVQLNTNENSYSVPQNVVDAVGEAISKVAPGLNRYPDRDFTPLRQELASYLASRTGVSLKYDQIWAANGSNEVLSHLVQAFGGPGRIAVGFTPGYAMHPIISETAGTTWVDGHRGLSGGERFDLDVDTAIRTVVENKPNVVFLCSPNNPTGTAMGLDIVDATYNAAPDALIVVDEAYGEFTRPGTPSAVSMLEGRPRLVVTRTMSKAFAMAGLRLGYLAAHPWVIEALRLVRLPYHLSAVTQATALAALAHSDLLQQQVTAIIEQRDRIVTGLQRMGLIPVPSDSNFVLFGGLRDARSTWERLLDQGVLIRDVGIPNHLRVTAGTPEEVTVFLTALERTLKS